MHNLPSHCFFVVQNFTIQTFYTNRSAVTDYMTSILAPALAAQHAILNAVQLRSVNLPAANEAQIVSKLVSAQLTQTANNVRWRGCDQGRRQQYAVLFILFSCPFLLQVQRQQDVLANTTVQVGQIRQQVQLFSANQTQIAIQITQSAVAQAKRIQLSASAVAYATFRRLSSFSPNQLLQFLSYQNMRQLATAEVVMGFPGGVSSFIT
jgi:hypothetical protein